MKKAELEEVNKKLARGLHEAAQSNLDYEKQIKLLDLDIYDLKERVRELVREADQRRYKEHGHAEAFELVIKTIMKESSND